MRQVIAPAPVLRRYQAVVAQDKDVGFLVRSPGLRVGTTETSDEEWEAAVTVTGVWGFALQLDDEGLVDAGVNDGGSDAIPVVPVSAGCADFGKLFGACVPGLTEAQLSGAQSACVELRNSLEGVRSAGSLNPLFDPLFDGCVANPANTTFCGFAKNVDGELTPGKVAEACYSWAAIKASPASYRNESTLDACVQASFADEAPSCNMVLQGAALACEQAFDTCKAGDPGHMGSDDVCYLAGLLLETKLPQFEACASRPCAEQKSCYQDAFRAFSKL
jgi:hypothetical protein